MTGNPLSLALISGELRQRPLVLLFYSALKNPFNKPEVAIVFSNYAKHSLGVPKCHHDFLSRCRHLKLAGQRIRTDPEDKPALALQKHIKGSFKLFSSIKFSAFLIADLPGSKTAWVINIYFCVIQNRKVSSVTPLMVTARIQHELDSHLTQKRPCSAEYHPSPHMGGSALMGPESNSEFSATPSLKEPSQAP